MAAYAPPSDKPAVTIRDVAKLAGVSLATVSNVVNGTRPVAAETRARVQRAVEALGYAPHAAARSMRGGTSGLIGLIVADITNPFFTSLVQSIERAASSYGHAVLLCNSDEDVEREQQHLQLLHTQRVDGIVLAKSPGRLAKETARLLEAARIPIVKLIRARADIGGDAVLLDDRHAAYEAVSHLVRLGYRRIGMISGKGDVSTTRRRVLGYKDALEEAGLPFDP